MAAYLQSVRVEAAVQASWQSRSLSATTTRGECPLAGAAKGAQLEQVQAAGPQRGLVALLGTCVPHTVFLTAEFRIAYMLVLSMKALAFLCTVHIRLQRVLLRAHLILQNAVRDVCAPGAHKVAL